MAVNNDDYLTIREACAYLKVGLETLRKLRKRRAIHTHYPFGEPDPAVPGQKGAMPRFKKSELAEFLEGK